MPVGKSFLDQYSVICVLGSVVGCVVVPLITQSMESLILSAILISITAKTLSTRMVASSNDFREDRRRPREKDHLVEKKVKRKKVLALQYPAPSQVVLDPDELQQRRQDEARKLEEQRALERERKLEEKREKKARKREDKLKRKEEERKEREEKEQLRKEKDEVKVSRKPESRPPILSSEQVAGMSAPKPTHHERHSSTSSSTSNTSMQVPSRQKGHSHKQGPSDSAPQLVPTPPPAPPSHHFKGWQPLPPAQGLLTWQPDVPPRRLERSQRVRESLPPRFKQSSQTPLVGSIERQCEGALLEVPSVCVSNPPVARPKPVDPVGVQARVGSQAVLNYNQGMGQALDIPDSSHPLPGPSHSQPNDVWATNGYYSLFSTSGYTLFGNAFLPPTCDRVDNWPDV